MNKRLLIISPNFPPVNAADMQRVRMSLPYFEGFGWDAEVVTVDEKYADTVTDDLLLQSIPPDLPIHKVKALNKYWTSKIGIGNIALRSLWFYRQKVNSILKNKKFDLIYFSTTQFAVCILGAYWKKRFSIPYIIDIQDPWHSDYYQDKPKDQQPSKYWFSYRLNKYLEPIALTHVDGLISVSENYITDLKSRYPQIKNIPSATITFGAFEPDLKIARANSNKFESLLNTQFINVVYIGRGGADMHKAIGILFETLKNGLNNDAELFKKIRLHFIGTSYAPPGEGKPDILSLAKKFGIENNVIEITDRISYYQTLLTLQQADALFIPGSDDPDYTASKIYPYLLTGKLLLTLFHSQSPAIPVLQEFGVKYAYSFDKTVDIGLKITDFFKQLINKSNTPTHYNSEAIKKYAAKNMTLEQCLLFNKVINTGETI